MLPAETTRRPALTDRLSDGLAGSALRVRRAVLGRRRLLAGVLAAVAVVAGLRATAAASPATVPVIVAAHDLPAGAVLDGDDVRVVDQLSDTAPDGAVRDPAGRVLAGPVRRGEPLTDARFVGPALTAGRPGLVTVPVRFPDAGMVDLLRVGDQIQVLAADPTGGEPLLLAHDCPVLALPAEPNGATALTQTGEQGRLVVLGVPATAVTSVSSASVSRYLTFAFAG